MALIVCPDCKSNVSSAASSCPCCGHPMHKTSKPILKPSKPLGVVLQLVALFMFLGFVFNLMGGDRSAWVYFWIGSAALLYGGWAVR